MGLKLNNTGAVQLTLRNNIPSLCFFGTPRLLPSAEKSGMLGGAPEFCGFPTQGRNPSAVCV
jgi:hypothetical protein